MIIVDTGFWVALANKNEKKASTPTINFIPN